MSVARAPARRTLPTASGRCALCGGADAVPCFRVDGVAIVRCAECGLVRQAARPAEPAALYGAAYYTADDPKGGYANYFADAAVNRRTFRRRLAAIEARLGRRGRLLDVGAALGDLVLEARAAGWDAMGVEVSPFAAGEARRRGADVRTGALEDVDLAPGSFDAVTLYDTLEHVPDPVATLAHARRLVRPDGIVHVVTPNVGGLQARLLGARWYHYKPDEHLFYFAPPTLRAAADRAGLRWDGWAPSGSYVTAAYVLDRLRYYAPLACRALGAAARAVGLGSLTFSLRVGEMEAWLRPERRSHRRPFRAAPVATARSAAWPLAAAAAVPLALLALFGFAVRDALSPRYAVSLFALACGLFFFLYALKYYVTSASVILLALLGDRIDALGARLRGGDDPTAGYRTLRRRPLEVVASDDPPRTRPRTRREPFVSVHLALYNESRVVDRLLAACTSFDYERYEVIVVDDSTDDTTERLERWRGARVRVVHRASRAGFKGGALQEALERTDRRAEYVVVFDADFVPRPDALRSFLDHFEADPDPRVAAVQGYQWHMLNASENWITKGIRAEFSGSYVLERTGQQLFGTMKMISGSVFMIRADVLRRLGWSTSITEDWDLTIRLYLAGHTVRYTPYIQAPAECVSTVRRLVRQRMRWAEGHTFNVKRYFARIVASPELTWREKAEFLYYAPYYLQSVVLTVGTATWLLGTFVLGQRLPMWGEILGWTLVVSNALALPLMNLTGVLLEGSLRRDAAGLLSFVALSWLLTPFQAYAAAKALLEPREGGWVRTPKSGRVTERVERFRLARLLPWELPIRLEHAPLPRRAQVAVVSLLVVCAVGILSVGALSLRALSASGARETGDHLALLVLGTALPLVVLVLGWWRLRRWAVAALFAVAIALSVNVVFLAAAIPADATAGTSSTFHLRASTAFACTDSDLDQAAPVSGTDATIAGWQGRTYTFCSDTFTPDMSIATGTVVVTSWWSNTHMTNACSISFDLRRSGVSLGTTTTSVPKKTTALTAFTSNIAITGFTFAGGERLELVLGGAGSNGCASTTLAYDSTAHDATMVTTTIVPEAVAGLALLAPLLPLALRRARQSSGRSSSGGGATSLLSAIHRRS